MPEILPKSAWTPYTAAHLLNRAGFGGTPEDVNAVYRLGCPAAVETLLRGNEDTDLFPAPSWAVPFDSLEYREKLKSASDEERRKLERERRADEQANIVSLRAWWMDRMRYSPHPLREKVTLFFHGHFATSFEKVNSAYLMYVQNEPLRAAGLGSFRDLVKHISRDPAMIRWLDLNQSQKKRPNENFAREVMELFTLGEGNYSETDIQESARAFTGYRVDPRTLEFRYDPNQHDDSEKTFMGRKGPFNGDDIIDIIVEQSACPSFMTRKIFTFFAYENPEPEVVEVFADIYRASNYNTSALLRAIFLSPIFYSKKAMHSQVKSPVQWMVQTSKALDVPTPGGAALEGAMRQMGQVLFQPPNVKGWDGNRAWISTSTLLFRYNLAAYFVNGKPPALEGMGGKKSEPIRISIERVAPQPTRADPDAVLDAVAFRMFNAPLTPADRARFLVFLEERRDRLDDHTIRDLMLLMMSSPEFQLT